MTMTRVAVTIGALAVAGLVVLIALGAHALLVPLATFAALGVLIGAGNLLYGKNSHGAQAQARTRPAQEARNRAIDEARRRVATDRADHPIDP